MTRLKLHKLGCEVLPGMYKFHPKNGSKLIHNLKLHNSIVKFQNHCRRRKNLLISQFHTPPGSPQKVSTIEDIFKKKMGRYIPPCEICEVSKFQPFFARKRRPAASPSRGYFQGKAGEIYKQAPDVSGKRTDVTSSTDFTGLTAAPVDRRPELELVDIMVLERHRILHCRKRFILNDFGKAKNHKKMGNLKSGEKRGVRAGETRFSSQIASFFGSFFPKSLILGRKSRGFVPYVLRA